MLWEPAMEPGGHGDAHGVAATAGELDHAGGRAARLEGVRLAPRFSDVARWLGAPDAIQPRCLPREELARHYLAAYARWGGSAVPLVQFLEETRLLCLKDTLKMLPFAFNRALDGGVDWTRDREEGRRLYRDEVYGQLTILLREIGGSGGTPRVSG